MTYSFILFVESKEVSASRQAVLVALCMTFGVEVGYKLSTSTVIWLANPCHIITITEVRQLLSFSAFWWNGFCFPRNLRNDKGASAMLINLQGSVLKCLIINSGTFAAMFYITKWLLNVLHKST